MQTAVHAYYDGKQVVVNEQDRLHLNAGDRLLITVLGGASVENLETLAERRLRILEEEKYVRPNGRTAAEIDRHIAEMRACVPAATPF